MAEKINDYIDLVERRIFELVLFIKETKNGKRYNNLTDLEALLKLNEDVLLCLRAHRDYSTPFRLVKRMDVSVEDPNSTRLIRSVFPYDHPLYGTDFEMGFPVKA